MSENTYSHANTSVVEMTGEPFKGGREPPGGDDMRERVERLENDMSEIKSDLKTIMRDLSEMKGRMSQMPSAKDFGELKGRVDGLPTTAKIASLLAIGVAALTIILRWGEIMASVNLP